MKHTRNKIFFRTQFSSFLERVFHHKMHMQSQKLQMRLSQMDIDPTPNLKNYISLILNSN